MELLRGRANSSPQDDVIRAKDFLEHNLCDFYVFQCNWSNENQLMTIYDEFYHFLCTRTVEVFFYDNAFLKAFLSFNGNVTNADEFYELLKAIEKVWQNDVKSYIKNFDKFQMTFLQRSISQIFRRTQTLFLLHYFHLFMLPTSYVCKWTMILWIVIIYQRYVYLCKFFFFRV